MATIAVFGVLAGGGAYAASKIGSGDIANNAVRSKHIKNNAVKAPKIADARWRPLSFAAGWANYGDGNVNAAYRKDATGTVQLRGVVTKTAGTPAAFDHIGTLPGGNRPDGRLHLAVAGGRPDTAGSLYVDANGTIHWLSGTTGEQDYTDLSSVSFYAD